MEVQSVYAHFCLKRAFSLLMSARSLSAARAASCKIKPRSVTRHGMCTQIQIQSLPMHVLFEVFYEPSYFEPSSHVLIFESGKTVWFSPALPPSLLLVVWRKSVVQVRDCFCAWEAHACHLHIAYCNVWYLRKQLPIVVKFFQSHCNVFVRFI